MITIHNNEIFSLDGEVLAYIPTVYTEMGDFRYEDLEGLINEFCLDNKEYEIVIQNDGDCIGILCDAYFENEVIDSEIIMFDDFTTY